MTSLTRSELGALGEQLAADHLSAVGFHILVRNWRCRYGEIDLVAADLAERAVVFVEVKTRSSDQFGGLAEAVTDRKVRRLRRLAGLWLAGQQYQWNSIRIDVIGIRVGAGRPQLTHVRGVG